MSKPQTHIAIAKNDWTTTGAGYPRCMRPSVDRSKVDVSRDPAAARSLGDPS